MYSRSDVEKLLQLQARFSVLLRGHLPSPSYAAQALMLWLLEHHAGPLGVIAAGERFVDVPVTTIAEDESCAVTVLAFPRVGAAEDVWKVRVYFDTAHDTLTFHEDGEYGS